MGALSISYAVTRDEIGRNDLPLPVIEGGHVDAAQPMFFIYIATVEIDEVGPTFDNPAAAAFCMSLALEVRIHT
jgi:hypothetical protein